MSHPFHYFTPGVSARELLPGNRLDAKVAKRVHLEHWLEAWKNPTALAIQDGVRIDGLSGAFFTPKVGDDFPPVSTYNPDQKVQQWLKTDEVWIGWEVGNEPGPEELERKSPLPGYRFECDGGQQWTVPIAKSPRGRETIPHDLDWDLATGKPTTVRAAKYDELWELAGHLQDFWNGENKDPSHDESWLYESALKALQVNYHIGPIELKAFRQMGRTVINQTRAASIGMILFDMDIAKDVKEALLNSGSKKN